MYSVTQECGKETVLALMTSRPDVIIVDPNDRAPQSETPTPAAKAPEQEENIRGEELLALIPESPAAAARRRSGGRCEVL